MRAPSSTSISALQTPGVPGWAIPRAPVEDPTEAAYMAGAALNCLDNLVRADLPWAGAWRQRVALNAATSAARLLGHREDSAALRDAWHLRPAGADPGPAGNVLAAWRRLASRSPMIDVDGLRSLTNLLGLAWTPAIEALPEAVEAAASSGVPAPLAAAAAARAVGAVTSGAEALAWWIADLTLARRMRWPIPVPVLATQIHAPALRGRSGGTRHRTGGERGGVTMCLAAAAGAAEACRFAGEIATRAARLDAVAPKLRAKGAGEAIALLLEDDAVSGTLTTSSLSRWASRRLFERLEALEAIRELSGRSTFRLYGL
ncbi:DUF1403 family protein [Xanthobacter autotrophicus]|uniref:DUF1403 family protein n=1 Tax=Xanthobacter TaxID=279 RepID=UPI0024AA312F|nr:DUF1403 family protein [Xanthobacter autotrophicus]MDI4667106.1 DUF1403 family protein [Xanthobacter autotrophicus]